MLRFRYPECGYASFGSRPLQPQDESTDITALLEAARAGDGAAADRALSAIWGQLQSLASRHLAAERGATIEPTAMVHECFVRLIGQNETPFANRGHFFRLAASCMRRLLIDRARTAKRLKRGGEAHRLTLDSRDLAPEDHADEFLALEVAMEKLKNVDERKHEVVMLRFFAGLTVDDTAACLEVSSATVKSDWAFARAWLQNELESA